MHARAGARAGGQREDANKRAIPDSTPVSSSDKHWLREVQQKLPIRSGSLMSTTTASVYAKRRNCHVSRYDLERVSGTVMGSRGF